MEVHRQSYRVYTIYLFLKLISRPLSDNMTTHNLGLYTGTLVVTLGETSRGTNLVTPPPPFQKKKERRKIVFEFFLL